VFVWHPAYQDRTLQGADAQGRACSLLARAAGPILPSENLMLRIGEGVGFPRSSTAYDSDVRLIRSRMRYFIPEPWRRRCRIKTCGRENDKPRCLAVPRTTISLQSQLGEKFPEKSQMLRQRSINGKRVSEFKTSQNRTTPSYSRYVANAIVFLHQKQFVRNRLLRIDANLRTRRTNRTDRAGDDACPLRGRNGSAPKHTSSRFCPSICFRGVTHLDYHSASQFPENTG
jgi:hypothetical protein